MFAQFGILVSYLCINVMKEQYAIVVPQNHKLCWFLHFFLWICRDSRCWWKVQWKTIGEIIILTIDSTGKRLELDMDSTERNDLRKELKTQEVNTASKTEFH